MSVPVRTLDLRGVPRNDVRRQSREWLVTNGLGGYACGSLSGRPERRFHGYLIAALPAPLGRVLMLSHLEVTARLPDGRIVMLDEDHLVELRLELGLPRWRYEIGPYTIEQRVVVLHGQNTVHVGFSLISGDQRVRLRVRPFVGWRAHEGRVEGAPNTGAVHVIGDRYELQPAHAELPPLRLHVVGGQRALTMDPALRSVEYSIERDRGYDHQGLIASPGYIRVDLTAGQDATLIASTESWETMLALGPSAALEAEVSRRLGLIRAAAPSLREGVAAELVLAADQFVIAPMTRVEEAARAHAEGDELRTVIAGYPWFTDWGRDTMISLEGLTLHTGRFQEAGRILRTFAHAVRDGLVPNLFPEGANEGLYHTADASLWFFHAVARYVEMTGDRETLAYILPVLRKIADAHIVGTRFGIGVDPADGLIRQGMEGYQLTWMDAKVDDWVVTPRRGKAVEINALFYNALRLLTAWMVESGEAAAAATYETAANRCKASFAARFWCEAKGHLYDVIDGERGHDDACRPNQLFAIALPYPILDPSRWAQVVEVCGRELLTPVGLRSLSRDHPDYKERYFGDLRARDAAYHQGTVWGWLIGPFVDAWRKVHPEDLDGLRKVITSFDPHMGEACVGTVSEIFDAEPPYTARGCFAQAWSVAELLRCRALLDG